MLLAYMVHPNKEYIGMDPVGKDIYNMGSEKPNLYINCENKITFFVYTGGIGGITDELPKIEATTKDKMIKMSSLKVANEIMITPKTLGEFAFTVSTMFKGKKITQNFEFEVIASPPVIVICVDENGKYLDGSAPLDINNMPNKIKLILTFLPF